MKRILKRIKEEILTYVEPVDIVTSLLTTAVLLFFSFVGYSRLTTADIYLPMGIGTHAVVFITLYGFPFPMVGILTPIGGQQTVAATWYWMLGNSNTQIFWTGLFSNIAIFFLSTFFAIFLYRRFIRR